MNKRWWALGLCFISTVHAVELKLDSVKYTLGMSGNYVESENVKARVLSFDAGLIVQDKITPNLYYHLSLIGNFENGSNQATGLTAEYDPNQAVNLREGGLVYNPWPFIKLEVGALNQNYNMSPLLVWNTAFAGIGQRISFGNFYFKAQQTIPNNNMLSRRIGGVNEGTPFFFMESLGVDYKSTRFKFHSEVSRFAYKDLSSQVAFVSQDFGNSVTGTGESAKFLYGFKGTNVALDSGVYITEGWLVGLSGQYLFNESAPDNRNTGHLAELGIGKEVFMIKGGVFRNESDSSPAFYNARLFGHNNMQGSIVSIVSRGEEYFVRASYVKAQMIENNVRQSDMNIFNFALVRTYDL